MNELAEEVEGLQNLLISLATGGGGDEKEYQRLRNKIIENPLLKENSPRFLRTCRDTSQFWQFIKYEYGSTPNVENSCGIASALFLKFLKAKPQLQQIIRSQMPYRN
jgi:hypothetical protein